MKKEEIMTEIEKNKIQIENQLVALNTQKDIIIGLIKPYVKKKNNETIVSTVSKDSENAKRIGIERLKELKTRAQNLFDNSDVILDEILSQSRFWQHELFRNLSYKEITKFCENGFQKANDAIHNAILYCLGYAGALLADFGFIEILSDVYFNYRSDGWFRKDGSVIRNERLLLSSDITQPINDYVRMISKLHMLVGDKERLSATLKEQETLDLWNQI